MQRHPTRTDDDPVLDDERLGDELATRDDDRAFVSHDPQGVSEGRIFDDDDDQGVTGARPSGTVSPTAEPVAAEAVTTRWRFTWGQVLILLAGAASLVFGIGAVALAGLAGSVTEPVVEVFTFDHTPLLGLIEIGTGIVLLLTGTVRGGRWVAGPVGVAMIVGGALVLAELDWPQTELAAERRFGWVPIVVGTAAYLGAMVPAKRRVTAER